MDTNEEKHYEVIRSTVSMPEALQQQRNIIAWHLKRLRFTKVTQGGEDGINMQSAACIDGLCLHMSYVAQWGGIIIIDDLAPYFKDLFDMVHAEQADGEVILDYLRKTLGPVRDFMALNSKTCNENIEYLSEELKKIGWDDSMM